MANDGDEYAIRIKGEIIMTESGRERPLPPSPEIRPVESDEKIVQARG